MVKYQNVSYANQLCIVIGHNNVRTEMNLCSYLKNTTVVQKNSTTVKPPPPPTPLHPSAPRFYIYSLTYFYMKIFVGVKQKMP